MGKQVFIRSAFGGSVVMMSLTLFLAGPLGSSQVEPVPNAQVPPVTIEPVAGTKLNRITLTPRAAERLDIQIGAVSEQTIVPTQVVGGHVVKATADSHLEHPIRSSAGTPGGASQEQTLISVSLSWDEWERLAKDRPARLLPEGAEAVPAVAANGVPSSMMPVVDPTSSMLTIYFRPVDGQRDFRPDESLRVELSQSGPSAPEVVVPYSAVYYGADGDAWVYVRAEPLVYQRQQIAIERIVGNWAVLSDGPTVGTKVVTVGAALLYGTEIFGK